jgi:hypothetical protein
MSGRALVAARLATLGYGQKKADAEIQASALSQAEAAELLKISRDSVQAARKVLESGTPELIRAVEQGGRRP